MATLITSGGQSEFARLGDWEGYFKENDSGYLELTLAVIPPGFDALLSGMDWGLRQAGVHLTKDSEVLSDRRVRIYFKKTIAPLVLIGAAIIGFFVIALVSFRLFKNEAIAASTLLILVIALVGGILIILATKSKFSLGGST